MNMWQLSYMFTQHLLYKTETNSTEMSEKFRGNEVRSGATRRVAEKQTRARRKEEGEMMK